MMTQSLKSSQMPSPASSKGFITYLLEEGYISEDQLVVGEKELETHPTLSLIDILTSLGLLDQHTMALAWSKFSNHTLRNLAHISVPQDLLEKWPERLAQRFTCIVIAQTQSTITAVAAEPDSIHLKDILHQYFPKKKIEISPATYRDIHQKISLLYKSSDFFHQQLNSLHQSEKNMPQAANSSTPVVNVIETTLEDALGQGASDIHFLPQESFVQLSYRLDGLLTPIRTIHKKFWPALSSRLKVLADLNLAESRLPQNGRFSLDYQRRPIDCRLSTHPAIHGESLVIRLLDKYILPPELDALGFTPTFIETLQACVALPHGLFLVIGPTGSGKTTTLHALLHELRGPSVKIMTLEQPIEYVQRHLCQTEVPEEGPLTFPQGVRSLLRQDPDILLIGEIRDEETAQMAVRAALTGHLVLSTLHAADAPSALQRLYNLGLSAEILKATLRGILCQRLLRRRCPCTATHTAGKKAAAGCALCAHRGYKGRLSVGEIHTYDATKNTLHIQTDSMESNALELIAAKATTAPEARRVLGPGPWGPKKAGASKI